MTIRNGTPIKFSPKGLSDALDSSNVFSGAMQQLSNLIPDPTTQNLWQCRPAATTVANFATTGGDFSPADFSADFNIGFLVTGGTGFISAMKIVGNRVFGMISTNRFANHDEPFCFDLVTNTFVSVSGVTSANTPLSPTTSGDWVPPTMDLIGVNLVVTHPGYTGAGGIMFGWFNISNPANITWTAGNTTTTLLPAPPTAVKQFFNRAYFIVNPATGQPAAYFTDVLTLTITDPTHIITFNDNVRLTALGALPLNSQLTGGVIQSLIVFKAAAQMWQITGDAALASNPLNVNSMNVATGTNAPLSICATSKGLAFIAPDGLRVIAFNGSISDPIGDAGGGITLPFIFAIAPSRIAASASAKTYRVSVQNGAAIATPNQEFWYDIPRGAWSGPHTFPASQIQAYNNTFIEAPIGVLAKLFRSDSVQGATSTYVENGNQMSFTWATSMLPDTQQMSENAMIESTINMALAAGSILSIFAANQDGAVFDSITISAPTAATLWGQFNWGQALWQGGANVLAPRPLNWHFPIVFRRLFIGVTGNCAQSLKIGDMFLRYQQLGYLQQISAA